ncbi:hypothetical protein MWN33_18715 [Starkeya koreensis]|uniref:Transglycosylase SLT domain-containing protein n=1 Tax=Ancylobacter koreensis TaxID=266121 RepID=A0ABT0DS94_9HYPH|nr:hypothetical protein [Ancylobacter koreensis]MCK0210069.1 hypothetical protein [Ancylobacter koreensis]
MSNELADAIRASSERLGVSPNDLATAMSYETGGTFDPWKKGPTTKWGEHRGLIQWGEPQRAKYGVTQDMTVTAQVEAAERYLKDAGVKPGMGLLDIYSAINAGGVGRYDRSDAAAGGAPGTVKDKVETQMEAHKAKAAALLGGQDILPSDRAPTRPITVPEQMAAEAAPGPGIGETVAAAAQEHSLTGWLLSKPWLMPDDPDFTLTEDRLKALTKGIPQDRWGAFENAASADQANAIRGELLAQMDRQRTLSEAGITGALLSVGASLGDPIGIGVGIATAGTGNAIMWGTKLNKLQRALRAGAAGAAINAGLAGAEESLKPNPEWDAVLLAGAGGAFMGAAFGSLSKMPHMAEEAAALRQLSKDTVEEVEGAYGAVPLRPRDSSAGAASSGTEHSSLRTDAADYVQHATEQNAPEAALGSVRFDATGRAKMSKNPLTRMFANVLGEDAVGSANKAEATLYSAMEDQALIARKMDARLSQEHETAYRAWVKEKGYGLGERDLARQTFNEEVAHAVSSLDPSDSFDPHVMKAAKGTERFFHDYHVMASDPGAAIGLAGQLRPVAGFGPGAPPAKGYLPRIFDYAKVTASYARHGLPALTQATAVAMRRLNPDLAPELLDKVARGYVRKMRELAYGANIRTHGAFFGSDLEGVRGLLSDLDGLSPDDVENVMAQLTRPTDKASVTRAKHRVLLDENLRLEMSDGSVTSFAELFLERDVQKLTRTYNRQMSGRIAAARMRVENVVEGERHLLIDGITHDGEFDTLIEKVRAVAAEVGQDRAELESDVNLLTYLYKGTVGIPVHDQNTGLATAGRLARDYGLARVLGQVGFAQIAELGNIFASSGVKAALASIPGFRVIARDAATGKLGSAIGQEIEAIWGFGAERLRNAGNWRQSGDPEWGTQAVTAPWVGKVERGLGIAKHVTLEVSGLNAINTGLHRWSTNSILHWFSRAASGEATIPVQRLRSLGLTGDMAERVMGQMRTHRTLVEGSSFKLERINLDKWDDLEAAAHFERAVDRRARRMVQENSIGMLAPWMSHPVAQVVLQFRTFVIGAHSKQLLHNVHMWDRESVAVFLATTFAGAMGHVAQTVANAPTLSERQLEERLSAKGIALGAFQRTGMSALVPMLVDTAARITGRDPVFSSRSTGLSASIFGNPTMGLVDELPNAVSAIVAPFAQGRQMSRQEMRDVLRPLIWQNTLPVTALFGAMSQGRPEFVPKAR